MAKRTSRKPKRSSRRRTSRRNGYGRGRSADPRWITARFDGIDDEGNKVRKGDEVLYWPSTKRVQTGEKAQAAWRRFLSEKGDEEGTPFASNPRRRKRTSRRNASFDQTYYVRMAPEDVWSIYHLPLQQEMVLHAPPGMKVSARMTLPQARKVARWYLSIVESPFDRVEIMRFAGTGWVGKSFVSMLEEQWGRRPKKGGGFVISQYQGVAGYRKLRSRKNGRSEAHVEFYRHVDDERNALERSLRGRSKREQDDARNGLERRLKSEAMRLFGHTAATRMVF